MRVGVIGAAGRMGSEVCRAVEGADDLELVARVDVDDDLQVLVDDGVEVAVEFTVPTSVKDNVAFCLRNGIHTVVGATGLSEEAIAELSDLARSGDANLFIAPNFAVGAVLMMRFAAQAASHFDRVEIIERHHDRKVDAPSGTALRTAEGIDEARSAPWGSGVDESEKLSGVRGGEAAGIRIHSLRLPGSVAHQEVVFGSPGETLTIRHDSLDRSSFMPGVLLAVRKVGSLSEPTVGLEHLLDL